MLLFGKNNVPWISFLLLYCFLLLVSEDKHGLFIPIYISSYQRRLIESKTDSGNGETPQAFICQCQAHQVLHLLQLKFRSHSYKFSSNETGLSIVNFSGARISPVDFRATLHSVAQSSLNTGESGSAFQTSLKKLFKLTSDMVWLPSVHRAKSQA